MQQIDTKGQKGVTMFFFIGGIQPRTTVIERKPGTCPYCSHNDIRLKRTDHYLALFFIPLVRVKKGMPYLTCDHCSTILNETGSYTAPGGWNTTREKRCDSCGREMETDFTYCPYCGEKRA
jgi:RNA polymerase subunit RPABC4/transcription elongation factor Spt4